MQHRNAFILLAVLLTSCTADDHVPIVLSRPASELSCVTQGQSRWDIEASLPGNFIGDEGLTGEFGVVWNADTLYVFDRMFGTVALLDLRGDEHYHFGRSGQGPGELSSNGPAQRHKKFVTWIDVADDTIVVFDGLRVHRFDERKEFVDDITTPIRRLYTAIGFTRRIRAVPGGLLVDVEPGGYANLVSKSGRSVGIWQVTSDRVVQVAHLQLAELPMSSRGVRLKGLAEARPLWDLAGDCVAYTDGAASSLFVGSTKSSAVDTISIPLPDDRFVPRGNPEELHLPRGSEVPDPGAERRVLDLVADPDGWIWLLVVQPNSREIEGVEVIRVDVQNARAVTDTLPAFPIAFGPPGVIIANTTDPSGLSRLTVFGKQ